MALRRWLWTHKRGPFAPSNQFLTEGMKLVTIQTWFLLSRMWNLQPQLAYHEQRIALRFQVVAREVWWVQQEGPDGAVEALKSRAYETPVHSLDQQPQNVQVGSEGSAISPISLIVSYQNLSLCDLRCGSTEHLINEDVRDCLLASKTLTQFRRRQKVCLKGGAHWRAVGFAFQWLTTSSKASAMSKIQRGLNAAGCTAGGHPNKPAASETQTK